ncbi:MAG: hypothetical protein WD294_12145 [Phycisphaeraceae bacterium]
MRATRIDLEGRPGHYASISRKRGSDRIDVRLLTPDTPNGRDHHVQADCIDDIRSMAECLQFHLDGRRGTNSDIHGYFRELERFAN